MAYQKRGNTKYYNTFRQKVNARLNQLRKAMEAGNWKAIDKREAVLLRSLLDVYKQRDKASADAMAKYADFFGD